MAIQWKRGDYVSLGRAVANFNRKIKQIENEENKLLLPEKANYQELKKDIQTRKELNNLIKSLNRIILKNASDIIIVNGEERLRWEYNETKRASKQRIKYYEKQIENLNKTTPNKFSLAQMGNINEEKYKARIRNLKNFSINKNLNQYKDISYRHALQYRLNFMEQLEDLKDSEDSFIEIYNHFNKIKDPFRFFEEAQKSEDLKSFFAWYKNPESYGGFSIEDLVENIMNNYE